MTEYVLIKRDLFECPKHLGYTGIKDLAGAWPADHFAAWDIPIKEKYEKGEYGHYALPIGLAPDFTDACFHDLAQAHLEKKRAAKDKVSDEQLRFEETMRSKTPRQVLANVRRLIGKRRIPNWALAMEVYAVGSTYGHWICVDNGVDPDAYRLTAFDQPTPAKGESA